MVSPTSGRPPRTIPATGLSPTRTLRLVVLGGRLADNQWICDKKHGFQTETQVWYNTLTDGSTVMVQVIWSYLR